MVIFRIAGKRPLSEATPFDFVLLLIIGEATQQALPGDDFSVTNAFLLITTLVATNIGVSLLKQRTPGAEKWLEGLPLVLVDDGRPLIARTNKSRVNESDILEAARQLQGLERINQIKYAVLERNGGITVIPKRETNE